MNQDVPSKVVCHHLREIPGDWDYLIVEEIWSMTGF